MRTCPHYAAAAYEAKLDDSGLGYTVYQYIGGLNLCDSERSQPTSLSCIKIIGHVISCMDQGKCPTCPTVSAGRACYSHLTRKHTLVKALIYCLCIEKHFFLHFLRCFIYQNPEGSVIFNISPCPPDFSGLLWLRREAH